jgi:hypothetical protein
MGATYPGELREFISHLIVVTSPNVPAALVGAASEGNCCFLARPSFEFPYQAPSARCCIRKSETSFCLSL